MLSLPAQLTLREARQTAELLSREIAQAGADVELDASALQALDSSALSVLLEARRAALAAGRGFKVSGAPQRLCALARLYGVAELLGLEAATA